MQDRKK